MLGVTRSRGRRTSRRQRILAAAAALVSITALGTAGYMLVEQASASDALYMTVVTLSTVGYREIIPLSPAGRVFTMFLIVFGVGAVLYLLTVLAESVIEGWFLDLTRRGAVQREIDKRSHHVIVCGYGRFGSVVAEDLAQEGRELVVVERDVTREAELRRAGVAYVLGSATSDEALEQAGIRRADAIVVAVASEADAVFVALSARELAPDIRIYARGESEAAVRRLHRAGANHVTSPLHMGGARTAAAILRPSVVDFLELSARNRGEEIDLEEVRVAPGSEIAGAPVSAVEDGAPRLRIVALKRGGEPIELVPARTTRIAAGDHLVAIGERAQLARLAERAQTSPA